MRNTVPEWLLKETFAIQYNANCPSPYLVRVIGHGKATLDLLGYVGKSAETRDAIGFGKSIEEAALRAKLARIEQSNSADAGEGS
jgi:hypothetical protein